MNVRGLLVAGALALALPGCATAPSPSSPQGTTSSLMPTGRRETPSSAHPDERGAANGSGAAAASGASRPSATAPPGIVPADSLPSRDARAVLESIPEPLPAAERVAPPDVKALRVTADSARAARPDASPASPADTARPAADSTGAAADSSATPDASVPVPSPTQPLGDRPGALERMLAPDSTKKNLDAAIDSAMNARPAPSAKSGANSGAGATGAKGAAADSCFRIQVGAAANAREAERIRAAAASQMLIPMVTEKEKGLYKVRTKDCYPSLSAEPLRRRAVAAGFHGVFRIAAKK
ncbi:MAG TPA: hypothetical protein VL332_02355 [Candidatus Saccharimonadaceae bacterium]|jgi:hypothetical protein|nr:hypothetical protein [Candidatus Saccharimonadaceae bacterium]